MDLSLFNLLFLLFIHKLPYAISRGIIDTFARAILTFSENTGEPTGRSSNGFPSAGWSKFSSNGFVLSAYSIFSSSSRKGLRPFFCEKKGFDKSRKRQTKSKFKWHLFDSISYSVQKSCVTFSRTLEAPVAWGCKQSLLSQDFLQTLENIWLTPD